MTLLSAVTVASCTASPMPIACEQLSLSHRSLLTRADMEAVTAMNEAAVKE